MFKSFYSYYQVLWQYRSLIFTSTKHYQTSHEDYPPNYSPNRKRFSSHNLFHYLLQCIDILLLRKKNLLLQMACFLNIRSKIGTVCPHNVFWTKAIQDEDKLLKRINRFSQLHYHWLKQGYQWGERVQQFKPWNRLHTDQPWGCETASIVSGEEGSTYFILLRSLDQTLLFDGPIWAPMNWFHNASCLPPAALLSNLVVAVIANVLEWF